MVHYRFHESFRTEATLSQSNIVPALILYLYKKHGVLRYGVTSQKMVLVSLALLWESRIQNVASYSSCISIQCPEDFRKSSNRDLGVDDSVTNLHICCKRMAFFRCRASPLLLPHLSTVRRIQYAVVSKIIATNILAILETSQEQNRVKTRTASWLQVSRTTTWGQNYTRSQHKLCIRQHEIISSLLRRRPYP
jgi:hypothetical protein